MEKYLKLPFSEHQARELEIGDVVYLSGEIVQFTGAAHKRTLQFAAEGKELPFDLENMTVYHSYTCFTEREGNICCEYVGATTSAKINFYGPDLIRKFKVRAIIGKGGMNNETLKAMQEVGCIYLAQVGGCSQVYTETVNEIKAKNWEDLGPNLVLRIVVERMGPLIVAMDSKGNSLYQKMLDDLNNNLFKERSFENSYFG